MLACGSPFQYFDFLFVYYFHKKSVMKVILFSAQMLSIPSELKIVAPLLNQVHISFLLVHEMNTNQILCSYKLVASGV